MRSFSSALHHDPVEVALDESAQPVGIDLAMGRRGRARFAQRADPRAGLGRLLLADDAADFVERRRAHPLLVERRRAGEQFVEQHAQRVDVAAGVDVEAGHLRLLGAHVERRADHLGEGGEQRLLGELLARRLGHAEVDHLGHRLGRRGA